MKSKLNNHLIVSIVAGVLAVGAAPAYAVEDIVASARAGCQAEIDSYCKDVSEGEGRVLACLSAHDDKLSARCNYALYDASAQLERFAVAIKYVAAECGSDIEKNCANVPIGDGRVSECLKKNTKTLTDSCKQAMKDTQMKVE